MGSWGAPRCLCEWLQCPLGWRDEHVQTSSDHTLKRANVFIVCELYSLRNSPFNINSGGLSFLLPKEYDIFIIGSIHLGEAQGRMWSLSLQMPLAT